MLIGSALLHRHRPLAAGAQLILARRMSSVTRVEAEMAGTSEKGRIADPPLKHLFDGMSIDLYSEDVCNLCAGCPGPDLLRPCAGMFQVATQHRMEMEKQDAHLFQYGASPGPWDFREELSRFLTERYKDPVHREDLILTCGATHGLQLLLSFFVASNGVIFVEEVTYMIAIRVFREFSGLKIVPVPVTDDGVDVKALEALARREKAARTGDNCGKPFWAAFYTIPVYHNPTGICSSTEVRDGVLRVARALELLVVCDDVYNLLHYEPTRPSPQRWFSAERSSSSWDARHVVSNGSFSKILAPGVRVGWLELPEALAVPLRTSGFLTSGGGVNSYVAGVVTSALQLGMVQSNLDKLVAAFKGRMQVLCDALDAHLPPGCSFQRPSGGYFVWLRLPEHVDGDALCEFMRTTRSVSAFPGSMFSPTGSHRHCLRLAIAFHEEHRLRAAARHLCEAIADYLQSSHQSSGQLNGKATT